MDGRFLATLNGSRVSLYDAVFSPDGQRILTTDFANTVLVYSVDGRLLATLQGHLSRIMLAAFSFDNVHIVTASLDGTARVYRLLTLADIVKELAKH